MLRGAILTAVSHLELCIAELSLRASYVPEYDAAAARQASLPANTTQRVKFLVEVIEYDGPLRRHAEWLRRAFKRWESFRELRNRMAHGHMTVFRGGPIRFREIVARRREITEGTVSYYGDELEAAALNIARFSRVYQRIWSRAYGSKFLPTIDEVASARCSQSTSES